jgi:hypothetical protein
MSEHAPWWYLAVNFYGPLVLIALVVGALLVEGLRRLWAAWRRRRG